MSVNDPEPITEWLSAYLDGELDETQRRHVERRLRDDAAVRRLFQQLQKTASLVSTLPRHPAPSSIAEDVLAHIERADLLGDVGYQAGHPVKQRSPLPAVLSMAAVLALVATGLWFMAGYDRTRSSSKESAVALAPDRPAQDSLKKVAASKRRRLVRKLKEKPFLATAGFDQKRQAGMKLSAVKRHVFDHEPVHLQVAVRNKEERDALAARLATYLTKQHMKDLAKSSRRRPAGSPAKVGAFFYQGQAGRNFPQREQRQFLVHASRGQLEGMVNELARVTHRKGSVVLRAGPVVINGWKQTQTALRGVASTGNAPSSSVQIAASNDRPSSSIGHDTDKNKVLREQGSNDGGSLLDGLLKTIGLDSAMISQANRERDGSLSVDETESKQVASAGGNKASLTQSNARRAQPNTVGPDDAGRTRQFKRAATGGKESKRLGSSPLQEPESLVTRRWKALVDAKGRGARISGRVEPTESSRVGRRGSPSGTVRGTKTGSVSNNAPITLVVQVVVTGKEPPGVLPPDKSTPPPAKTKVKRVN